MHVCVLLCIECEWHKNNNVVVFPSSFSIMVVSRQPMIASHEQDVQKILLAMKVHAPNPNFQRNCLVALGNLAADDSKETMLVKGGAIPAILSAMQHHVASSQVQFLGSYALANLTQSDHNRKVVAEAGAVPVIVRAMEQHRQDAEVQQLGCHVLANLAAEEVCKFALCIAVCTFVHFTGW